MSSFDRINRIHGLSLKRGSRVEYTGGTEPRRGVVTSSEGQYINVRFDGDKKAAGPFHPTWKIRAIDEATP